MLASTAPPAPLASFDLLADPAVFAVGCVNVTIVPALSGVRVLLKHGEMLVWTARCASLKDAQAFARDYVASRAFRADADDQAERSAFTHYPRQ